MTIRTRTSLITAGLIGAVVASVALTVARTQRGVLEAQSRQRLEDVGEGVARVAKESIDDQDRFMLLSYFMYLRREHPELVYAAVSRDGHTARIGEEAPGLVYWSTAVSAAPLTRPGARPQTEGIKLGFSRAALDAGMARALRDLYGRLLAIALLFMALGLAAAYATARLLTAPLTTLTAAVNAVGEGRFDVSVEAARSDEIGVLARRFNEMTARIRELVAFREDVLHTLTHEINTPLGALKGYLELWQERGLPESARKRDDVLQTMSSAVLRMESSLGSALEMFKPGGKAQAGPRKLVWLDGVAREVCTLFASVARSRRITLALPPPEAVECVYADDEPVRRIVTNLVSNALKYSPEGSTVTLSLGSDEKLAYLKVADQGRGIPAEDLSRIFTKFYRAGAEGEQRRVAGSGLGLMIAQRAAQALGGTLSVESEVGKGSVFTVEIPRRIPKGGRHDA